MEYELIVTKSYCLFPPFLIPEDKFTEQGIHWSICVSIHRGQSFVELAFQAKDSLDGRGLSKDSSYIGIVDETLRVTQRCFQGLSQSLLQKSLINDRNRIFCSEPRRKPDITAIFEPFIGAFCCSNRLGVRMETADC